MEGLNWGSAVKMAVKYRRLRTFCGLMQKDRTRSQALPLCDKLLARAGKFEDNSIAFNVISRRGQFRRVS